MKKTIGIFIHNPQCETGCALGMITGFIDEFNIRTFGLDEFNYDFLSQLDVVAFPGGTGDADEFYDIFDHTHIEALQDYVANGGKYFGICMGAYWAGPHYFDVVDNLEIEQYIAQPNADITTEYSTEADVLWNNKPEVMYFYDGCAILGDKMRVIATYKNGNAMAAIQNNVGMIGCHPEALADWYLDSGFYNPIHAELMCEFVNDLIYG